MSMISSPPIGATAYGVSGQAHAVMQIVDDRVILTSPDGSAKRAPLSAIVRWELPPPTEVPPQPFKPGDRVRYIGKNPPLVQVTWARDWFEVMAVVGEMVAFRHRDWWVTRECPATDLSKYRRNYETTNSHAAMAAFWNGLEPLE
jgi:hypothetical protein